ncbi:MAG TPA: histidine kinase [Nocardioidaceae bacterium]|nr:histidine kinase [Nocardioidaceae bacterium]
MSISAEPHQPPLDHWSYALRFFGMLAMSFFVWADIVGQQWEERRAFFWLDLGVGLVCFVLVWWRRRWPLGVAVTTTLANMVSASAAGPATLALVSLSTHRKLSRIIPVAALGVLMPMIYRSFQHTSGETTIVWFDYVYYAAITAAICAGGMYIGSRRELYWMLRERAEQAEREQEQRLSQARTSERAQIAREMHDVLAHRMSLVTMHAGALAYRDDLSKAEVQASAAVVQQKAGEALHDLRHVLGVLREPDGSAATHDRPQPTLCDIDDLVAEASLAGMLVELTNEVVSEVPDLVGRTAYRIVQEALTNARKHASTPLAKVTITEDAAGLQITVWNPWSPYAPTNRDGAGLGLVGLAERVKLADGKLRHVADGEGFTLTAWLPLATPST